MPDVPDAVPSPPDLPSIVVTYTHTADQMAIVGLALIVAIVLLTVIAARDTVAILAARRRR